MSLVRGNGSSDFDILVAIDLLSPFFFFFCIDFFFVLLKVDLIFLRGDYQWFDGFIYPFLFHCRMFTVELVVVV